MACRGTKGLAMQRILGFMASICGTEVSERRVEREAGWRPGHLGSCIASTWSSSRAFNVGCDAVGALCWHWAPAGAVLCQQAALWSHNKPTPSLHCM
jgi:hypothetical protein